jgi:HSF-type DNA-binding
MDSYVGQELMHNDVAESQGASDTSQHSEACHSSKITNMEAAPSQIKLTSVLEQQSVGDDEKPKSVGHDELNIGNDDDDDDANEDERGGKNTDRTDDLFRVNTGLLTFPEKLMSLLDSDKVGDAMRWLQDGDAFCLVPTLFSEHVLDKYFQGTKFESFTRKLNRWYVSISSYYQNPPLRLLSDLIILSVVTIQQL